MQTSCADCPLPPTRRRKSRTREFAGLIAGLPLACKTAQSRIERGCRSGSRPSTLQGVPTVHNRRHDNKCRACAPKRARVCRTVSSLGWFHQLFCLCSFGRPQPGSRSRLIRVDPASIPRPSTGQTPLAGFQACLLRGSSLLSRTSDQSIAHERRWRPREPPHSKPTARHG